VRSLAVVCLLAVSLVPFSPAAARVRFGTHDPLVRPASTFPGIVRTHAGFGVSDWVECGVEVTPATTNTTSYQQVRSDGAQGAVIAWSDERAGRLQAYASRLDGTGNLVGGWSPGGNAISVSDSSQLLVGADTDGAGGAFFLYTNVDPQWNNSHDLYLQHLTSAGVVAAGFPAQGKTMVTGAVNVARMVADGAGGTFLFWSPYGSTIRIKRLDASGAAAAGWPVGGLDTGIPDATVEGEADLDGSGGVYLAWSEEVAGQFPVSVQRFVPGGPAIGWPVAGLGVGYGSFVTIARLSDGDAMVAWDSTGVLSDHLIIQRVESSGSTTLGWPIGGGTINISGKFPWDPRLVADAVGGAICAWQETALGGAGPGTLYAQRLKTTFGRFPGWPAEGVPLLTTASAVGHSIGALPELVSDGSSGAIAAWTDLRNGNPAVYAQRVLADGTIAWGTDGVEVCATGTQGYPVIATDGAAGAIVAWQDDTDSNNRQIRVARVLSDGTVSALASLVDAAAERGVVRLHWYTPDGSVVRATVERAEAGAEFAARGEVEADGAGHLRFEDHEVTPGATYEYRLAVLDGATTTYLGQVTIRVPAGVSFGIEGVSPNPAEGALSVAFALESAAPARLEVLDVAGRRVLAREVGALGPGQHILRLEKARLPAGIYTVRLAQSGRAVVTRAAIVR
jgi:hypothetical protein